MDDRTITPYALGILLHYYVRSDAHPDAADNSAPWRVNVRNMMDLGLLESSVSGTTYQTTERSRVFLETILRVQFPVQQWVIPA
jgi:hypothetical protein